jgi:hypothetical protein
MRAAQGGVRNESSGRCAWAAFSHSNKSQWFSSPGDTLSLSRHRQPLCSALIMPSKHTKYIHIYASNTSAPRKGLNFSYLSAANCFWLSLKYQYRKENINNSRAHSSASGFDMRRARGAKITHCIACHLKFFCASQKPQGEIHPAALFSS